MWQLGKECLDVSELAIHCTPKMAGFLENNHPFAFMLEHGNLILHRLEIDQELSVDGFSITPFKVPHPPIKETMELLVDCETEILFSHFNHTNPILGKNSKERKEVISRGFKIADDGSVMEF